MAANSNSDQVCHFIVTVAICMGPNGINHTCPLLPFSPSLAQISTSHVHNASQSPVENAQLSLPAY